MSVGARVNHLGKSIEEDTGQCEFGGWSHMVNLVTIRGEIFMVDVGVSGSVPNLWYARQPLIR